MPTGVFCMRANNQNTQQSPCFGRSTIRQVASSMLPSPVPGRGIAIRMVPLAGFVPERTWTTAPGDRVDRHWRLTLEAKSLEYTVPLRRGPDREERGRQEKDLTPGRISIECCLPLDGQPDGGPRTGFE